MNKILLCTLLSPLVGIIILLLIPSWNKLLLKQTALLSSCVSFIFSLCLWLNFNKSIGHFQCVNNISWTQYLNLSFSLGIDGISIFFLILTSLLIPLCMLVSWWIDSGTKEYFVAWLILEFLLLGFQRISNSSNSNQDLSLQLWKPYWTECNLELSI